VTKRGTILPKPCGFGVRSSNIKCALRTRRSGRGAVAEAIPHLVRVLMLTPWNSELHQDLGTLLVRNGEPGKALAQFSEALKYRPDWVQPRLSISEVLIAQGQPARAQSFLQEVLRTDPENSRAKI
jgi:Flp pilus assembly protein TadD